MWTEQQRARQQDQAHLCAGISVHRACNAPFPIAAVAPLQSTLPLHGNFLLQRSVKSV